MIVLVEATYPGEVAGEVATKWLEILKTNPFPEYVKLIELYAFTGGDGIRVLLFDDVEKGKEEEGLKYISKVVVDLLRDVKGYKAEVRTVSNTVDAFELLGMSAPTF